MTVYCYGRFRIPHKGHAKLFALCDIVLASKSPSLRHQQLLSEYASRRVYSIDSGSLLDWLTLHGNTQTDSVVLGSDNAALAARVAELGFAVLLVPRSDGCLSSTECRRLCVEGKPMTEQHDTKRQLCIAHELWSLGY